MKIVYFIDHLRGDGTQRALLQLTRGLQKRGHVQAIVCMNDGGDEKLIGQLQALEIQVRIVGKKNWLLGIGFIKTLEWLRAENFDAAVTLLYVSDLVGRPLARLAHIPRLICSLRARNIHYSPLKRTLTRLSMPLADAVVLNSGTLREFAISGEGVAPSQIVTIPNGICVENYLAPISRAALLDEWKLPADARVLASIGRLTPQKGFDILIQAMANLSDRKTHLILIGQGEQESALRALTAKLGIAARVHFAGYRHDVPALLGAFDVYVHPARFEGMPNAVMEAMAAGCPIVATAVDGTGELLGGDDDSWLVPPDDAGALTNALKEALRDPVMARQRGKRAQQRVATHFSERAMIDAWDQILCG